MYILLLCIILMVKKGIEFISIRRNGFLYSHMPVFTNILDLQRFSPYDPANPELH